MPPEQEQQKRADERRTGIVELIASKLGRDQVQLSRDRW